MKNKKKIVSLSLPTSNNTVWIDIGLQTLVRQDTLLGINKIGTLKSNFATTELRSITSELRTIYFTMVKWIPVLTIGRNLYSLHQCGIHSKYIDTNLLDFSCNISNIKIFSAYFTTITLIIVRLVFVSVHIVYWIWTLRLHTLLFKYWFASLHTPNHSVCEKIIFL